MLYDNNEDRSLYDIFNYKEYLDIKFNKCCLKQMHNIIMTYAKLISYSYDQYIIPDGKQNVDIIIDYTDHQGVQEFQNTISKIKNSCNKYELLEYIISEIKNVQIKHKVNFKLVLHSNKNNISENQDIEIDYNNNTVKISFIYDFYVFIKLQKGAYCDQKETIMNYCISYCLNNAKNILDFDIVITPLVLNNTFNLFGNIYYQYTDESKSNIQYLLKTDIQINNPIKLNNALRNMIADINFDNL